MQKLSTILAILGIALALIAIIGRFIDASTISFGGLFISMRASAALTVANTALLLSVITAIRAKK